MAHLPTGDAARPQWASRLPQWGIKTPHWGLKTPQWGEKNTPLGCSRRPVGCFADPTGAMPPPIGVGRPRPSGPGFRELAEMSSTVCANLRDSDFDQSCAMSKTLKTHPSAPIPSTSKMCLTRHTSPSPDDRKRPREALAPTLVRTRSPRAANRRCAKLAELPACPTARTGDRR